MTAFKARAVVWTLGILPNVFQVSGCISIVAAFFAIGLISGLFALGVFLCLVGWAVRS